MRRAWRGERGMRRGGFTRGRGKFGMEPDPNTLKSKKLSWALRHGCQSLGLTMNPSGYVKISDILAHPEFSTYTLEEIQEIAARDAKQRFGISLEKKEFWIRANQGHSIQGAADDSLLREITNPTEFPLVIHGSYKAHLESIGKRGLSRMQRNHIHFATAIPGEGEVISGARASCDVFIEIDLPKALSEGIKFYVSENNVILTPGIHGFLAPKYFKRIIRDRAEVSIKSKTLDLDFLLLVDMKTTCTETGKPKCEELIEITVSALNCRNRQIEHQFHSYVKPELMPELGQFCAETTRVAQDMVDSATPLRELLGGFHSWLQHTNIFNSCWIIAVNKDSDIKTLIKEFNHKKIDNQEYWNHWIELTFLIPDKNELKTATEKLGFDVTGNTTEDLIRNFTAILEAGLLIYESDVQHRANKAPVSRPPYANPPLPPVREETKEEMMEKQLRSESYNLDTLLIFVFDTVKDKTREVAIAVYICLYDLARKKVLSNHKKLIKPDRGIAFNHQAILGISERIYYEKASSFAEFESYLKSLASQPQIGRCALATLSDREFREIIPSTGTISDPVFFRRWINLYKFFTRQPNDSENNFGILMDGFLKQNAGRINGEAKLKHLVEATTVRLLNIEERIHTSHLTYL